jgi:hypothetical protein
MKRLIYLGVGFALMGVGGTMWTSCSDIEAGDELVAPATESAISIGNFPTYSNDQTRAVDGTPTDDKTAWADGDLIYLQITPKDATATWYTLEFEDGKWVPTETLPTLQATDEWKAVYAPNYEVTTSSGSTTSLSLISGKTNASAEYLTCAGTGKPIAIAFERTYARLRIYCGAREVNVNGRAPYVLIEGFCPSDQMTGKGTDFLTYIIPDESGNFYLYGTWPGGKYMDIQTPSDNVFLVDAAQYIYCGIPCGSTIVPAPVANTTYAVDYESVTVDLDKIPAEISSWTTYTDAGFTQFRVIGTWNSAKPLSFERAAVTRVDLSQVQDMTSIPNYMFEHCASLQTIKFPANVTTIGALAFAYCSNLTLDSLPETLQKIGMNAFSGNTSERGCTIAFSELPQSIQSVGMDAFSEARFVKPFTWPAHISAIPERAFQNYNRAIFEIPEGVTSIGKSAFAFAYLMEITLPSSITFIDKYAFKSCATLSKITCLATEPPTISDDNDAYWDVFEGIPSGAILYVPAESVDKYVDADWDFYFYPDNIQAIPTTTE